MISALKLVTVQRGHDPRDLVLVVTGGAGPMMAAKLGQELRTKATAIPPYPGLFSAWGMLSAAPRADLCQTFFGPGCAETMAGVADRFAHLRDDAAAYFGTSGEAEIAFHHKVEARYKGQEHSVLTDLSTNFQYNEFAAAFHDAHETAYSFHLPDTPIEITNLHLQAVLESSTVSLPTIEDRSAGPDDGRTGERPVYFGDVIGWQTASVIERDRLPIETPVAGPLLIEEATTTTLVLPGQVLRMTEVGMLIMTHLMARGGFPGTRDAPRDGCPSGKRRNAPGKPPRATEGRSLFAAGCVAGRLTWGRTTARPDPTQRRKSIGQMGHYLPPLV